MSLFGRIANRIFGRASYQDASATPTPAGAPPATGSVMGGGAMGGASTASGSGAGDASRPAMANPDPQPAAVASETTIIRPSQPVDVEAVLNGIASQNPQKLNWRTSIVDLMKLLDLDSSLESRKELATELGYTGPKDGSAEMNTWLHRQVMTKLAENGGRVPDSLRA
ncbi:DUF3597 domain-containing protein [Roseomonas sp. CCTCC AB2023176]|uniref:DUF3597 domain-containing protein n=1 Tax=Roseomonas sp. CCTCC AB2023176 TaxID=3342640 RepID=UPI0035DB4CDE